MRVVEVTEYEGGFMVAVGLHGLVSARFVVPGKELCEALHAANMRLNTMRDLDEAKASAMVNRYAHA